MRSENLERPAEVAALLWAAEEALRAASYAATVSEGDRTGLQGETALLIGGLSQAVGSFAELLDDVGEGLSDS